MPSRTEIREALRVVLSPEELNIKAQELARHLQETAEIEAGQARERKAQGEHLKLRKAREQDLANDIAAGSEMREVVCVEEPDYQARVVRIIRTDTGEVVRMRAMQPGERQAELFVLNGAADERD